MVTVSFGENGALAKERISLDCDTVRRERHKTVSDFGAGVSDTILEALKRLALKEPSNVALQSVLREYSR